MKRLRKLNIIIGDEDAIINVDNVVDKGGKITKRKFDYFRVFKSSPFFKTNDISVVCQFLSAYHTLFYSIFCFVHPIFRFWFLVFFGYEVTKILHNLCLHFAKQDRQDEKTEEKITQLK
jgi:hypothetical protein